jgi:Protein of unknown function (DUF1676)
MGLLDRSQRSHISDSRKILSVSLVLILSVNVCLCETNTTNSIRSARDQSTYNFYDVSETTVESESTPTTTTTTTTLMPAFAHHNSTVLPKAGGNKPMFSTGNSLWDALIKECLRRPTFSCIQRNVYSYLDDQLSADDFNVTNRLLFFKNRVDFTKYTKEANMKYNTVDDEEEVDEGRAGRCHFHSSELNNSHVCE